MNTLTVELLGLTNRSYDEYNEILPAIKSRLDRVDIFEQVLSEELPLTTARRAFRTAIKVASGEPDVRREYPQELAGKKKFKK